MRFQATTQQNLRNERNEIPLEWWPRSCAQLGSGEGNLLHLPHSSGTSVIDWIRFCSPLIFRHLEQGPLERLTGLNIWCHLHNKDNGDLRSWLTQAQRMLNDSFAFRTFEAALVCPNLFDASTSSSSSLSHAPAPMHTSAPAAASPSRVSVPAPGGSTTVVNVMTSAAASVPDGSEGTRRVICDNSSVIMGAVQNFQESKQA